MGQVTYFPPGIAVPLWCGFPDDDVTLIRRNRPMPVALPSLHDQQVRQHAVYKQVEDHILETEIVPRVTAEIVEEHRVRPIGKHSDDLERVLVHLRKNSLEMAGKYILVCTKPHEEWRIAVISGVPGTPPELTDEAFDSRDGAEHGIFRRRLADRGLLPEGSRA
jgi:hypothetical protein